MGDQAQAPQTVVNVNMANEPKQRRHRLRLPGAGGAAVMSGPGARIARGAVQAPQSDETADQMRFRVMSGMPAI